MNRDAERHPGNGRPGVDDRRETIDDWDYVVGLRPQAETIGDVARSRRPVRTLDRCCSSSASVARPAVTKALRTCSTVARSSSVQAGRPSGSKRRTLRR
jgi:hypothetical protein